METNFALDCYSCSAGFQISRFEWHSKNMGSQIWHDACNANRTEHHCHPSKCPPSSIDPQNVWVQSFCDCPLTVKTAVLNRLPSNALQFNEANRKDLCIEEHCRKRFPVLNPQTVLFPSGPDGLAEVCVKGNTQLTIIGPLFKLNLPASLRFPLKGRQLGKWMEMWFRTAELCTGPNLICLRGHVFGLHSINQFA